MKNKKGFTMVELLAVIVILGIIMLMGIPAVNRYTQKGRDSYYENQKRNLISATKSYMDNTSLRPERVGDFYDVSLDELINKKYIDGLKDSGKADCYRTKQNDNDYSSYTFVRVIRTRNGFKYIAHLSCPDYQDDPLNNNAANMMFLVSKETYPDSGVIQHYNITVHIQHLASVNGSTAMITDYTYRIYKNDNMILSGSEVVGGPSCDFEYDVLSYLTTGNNTFKVAINALDERGRIGSTIETITINTQSDSALQCAPGSYINGGKYVCICTSRFGCKSNYYTGPASGGNPEIVIQDTIGNTARDHIY